MSQDVASHLETLYRDGVTALKGAFSREWVDRMREDMMTAFWGAMQRPGGAVGRGPRRWYVEIHPQDFQGFIELVTHPWVTAMCEAVLGREYEIVEIGFDTPFQSAKYQPWHRDFPSPADTYEQHRITSLAFNLTGIDVTQDMGSFEIAHGTHWDDGREWPHQMFRRSRCGRVMRNGAYAKSSDGRHLVPLCSDRTSRHRTPFADRTARSRAGCRCARRR
jgi:hypothetical protein